MIFSVLSGVEYRQNFLYEITLLELSLQKQRVISSSYDSYRSSYYLSGLSMNSNDLLTRFLPPLDYSQSMK
jgi:hypothetical protein